MILLLTLSLIILGILTSWIYFLRDRKSFNLPGPMPLPIIGNGYSFIGKPSELLPLLSRFREEFGHLYIIYLFHTRYTILSHPKHIEPVLTHQDLITKGKSYVYLRPWLGNGLLTSTGHRWRTMRKFLTPAFHFNILQNFLPVFLKNGNVLVKKLHKHADGKPFKVFRTVALTALDNVTESIMGVCIGAQSNSESKYVKAIEVIARIASLRMRNPFMGEDLIFNFVPYKKEQTEALDVLHSQSNQVIQKRRDELRNANISSLSGTAESGIRNKHAFLDLLLLAEVDGKKISDQHVREEVDTFMFEGHDTVSSGITFTLYCLSKHRDVQEKIMEEQKSILGENLDRDLQYFELQKMKYLEQVIKESLRLYPSVPLIERLVTKDVDIEGITFKKNTSIIINIFELQRHPDVFDNPLEFRPERFDAVISPQTAKNAFIWLPFSAGPRNCIGQKFAMMEMKVIISNVVKNFEILPVDAEEPSLCAELILRPEKELTLRLKPRAKSN